MYLEVPYLLIQTLPSLRGNFRDARRLKARASSGKRVSLRRSPSKANNSNAWMLNPATPNSFLILLLRRHLTLPRLFSGSAASSSLSSWSTVCSSAVPQARQPRDSPLHRLFRHPHTRAGAPHFPSGQLIHSSRNAHTRTPPCYEQQRRNTIRRTRLSWRRLSHSPCFRHPARLCHNLRDLRLRNLLVRASRMLSVQVSRLQRTR